ncbi:hypothetical protein ASPWEDRAFT_42704 [Aspergillus wentii DTO 134E9]|uniref:Uncharacterized protein n=1 Tax=Aspergillus wentii DTO 134E9 TaxID=1073089 RepID=A0A1L9RCQ5_ASPWE|nr:uncharacterized protein ASPWEDRAFT_42704 [Aspergillus wentii DTO 134E9]OJJ32694.1 hypothetical protein ASPWEDRAFT_42704 [Aspergillus wentii DTO 134E9]
MRHPDGDDAPSGHLQNTTLLPARLPRPNRPVHSLLSDLHPIHFRMLLPTRSTTTVLHHPLSPLPASPRRPSQILHGRVLPPTRNTTLTHSPTLPCAEDIISRNEPCQTDLTQEMLQSRHLLLHLQFKEELFSRLPECQLPSAIKRFRSYYTLHQSYHETKLTGVLVHWMRQKLGLDGEPVEERYIRVVDIEPSSGEYAGLPLLHRLAGGGICSEDGIRYIQHFTRVNKSSMGVRGSDKLRIPGPWSKK